MTTCRLNPAQAVRVKADVDSFFSCGQTLTTQPFKFVRFAVRDSAEAIGLSSILWRWMISGEWKLGPLIDLTKSILNYVQLNIVIV